MDIDRRHKSSEIETRNSLLLSNNGGQLISIFCSDSLRQIPTEGNEDGQMVTEHMIDCVTGEEPRA